MPSEKYYSPISLEVDPFEGRHGVPRQYLDGINQFKLVPAGAYTSLAALIAAKRTGMWQVDDGAAYTDLPASVRTDSSVRLILEVAVGGNVVNVVAKQTNGSEYNGVYSISTGSWLTPLRLSSNRQYLNVDATKYTSLAQLLSAVGAGYYSLASGAYASYTDLPFGCNANTWLFIKSVANSSNGAQVYVNMFHTVGPEWFGTVDVTAGAVVQPWQRAAENIVRPASVTATTLLDALFEVGPGMWDIHPNIYSAFPDLPLDVSAGWGIRAEVHVSQANAEYQIVHMHQVDGKEWVGTMQLSTRQWLMPLKRVATMERVYQCYHTANSGGLSMLRFVCEWCRQAGIPPGTWGKCCLPIHIEFGEVALLSRNKNGFPAAAVLEPGGFFGSLYIYEAPLYSGAGISAQNTGDWNIAVNADGHPGTAGARGSQWTTSDHNTTADGATNTACQLIQQTRGF